MKRKTSELVRLKNDENLTANVLVWRKAAKAAGFRIRFYGRCENRRGVFEMTYRKYHQNAANSNDISLSSVQADYCYEFVGYKTR